MGDSYRISYSFPESQGDSFREIRFCETDYAKQVSRSSGVVQRMVTVGTMMLTLTVCSASAAVENAPKLTFNTQLDTETIQRVYDSLQKAVELAAENKREIWKAEVVALAKLEENWDEEGALRVSTTAIKNVLNLLDHASVRVDLLQDVYANPNGTVSVEWANDNREYAGVQIGRKQMSYYVTRHQGSDYCNFEFINEENYKTLLAKLALL